jgi:hypothetical protein
MHTQRALHTHTGTHFIFCSHTHIICNYIYTDSTHTHSHSHIIIIYAAATLFIIFIIDPYALSPYLYTYLPLSLQYPCTL